jgi:Arc/MetJ family transcription regulator
MRRSNEMPSIDMFCMMAYICSIIMRTTLIINDELLKAAKHRAAERKCSVSAIVNEALRTTLGEKRSGGDAPQFQMPKYRGTGDVIDTPPAAFDALVSQDELETLRG